MLLTTYQSQTTTPQKKDSFAPFMLLWKLISLLQTAEGEKKQ